MRSTVLSLTLLAALAPLTLSLAACGVGTSQAIGTHEVPPPAEDAGPPDAQPPPPPDSDGGCSVRSGPEPVCTGCSGEVVAPLCTDGVWQCPLFGCPAQCGGSPYVTCPSGPSGQCAPYWSVECVENQWTCVEQVPNCEVTDASDDGPWQADGGPIIIDAGPQLSCAELGCDPATTYCQITTGGPVGEDGGAVTSSYCIPLPSSCPAGAEATCACVQADQGIGCGCVDAAGEVTVTCNIP